MRQKTLFCYLTYHCLKIIDMIKGEHHHSPATTPSPVTFFPRPLRSRSRWSHAMLPVTWGRGALRDTVPSGSEGDYKCTSFLTWLRIKFQQSDYLDKIHPTVLSSAIFLYAVKGVILWRFWRWNTQVDFLQYFPLVSIIILSTFCLIFKSVDRILKCVHLN